MKEQKNSGYSRLEKLTLAVFIISFALYFLNILLGKASVEWGWDVFYFGNIGEFILLLTASVFFIAAALHREAEVRRKQ